MVRNSSSIEAINRDLVMPPRPPLHNLGTPLAMTDPDPDTLLPTQADRPASSPFAVASSPPCLPHPIPGSPAPKPPSQQNQQTPLMDPTLTAKGVYVAIHGHFYQPPRENPYLESIERQPGAEPFHNWNERIYWECYRPNAFSRILSSTGEVEAIVNNFEYLSFNIGPTLMRWLKIYDPEVYERIVEGDRHSCRRLHGHGNAIAQVYNHMILPLASERDKITQIRWGKADFESHFGRPPEGMWLAETAVDYPTLEALVAEGIRFIILAPSQAQRCRSLPSASHSNPLWYTVNGGQIDPTRPYRCFLKGQHPTTASSTLWPPLSGTKDGTKDKDGTKNGTKNGTNAGQPSGFYAAPYIDIFFYDGPISRDMSFSDLLSDAQVWSDRLNTAIKGDQRSAQLLSMAIDGETFGHHRKGAEKCLSYGFSRSFPQRGWTVTNFAHYLSLQAPTWEVELKPVTAWSCSHGVDRWQRHCGCGQEGDTHQHWRQPLRQALDWLRDQLADIYEEQGSRLFLDPWMVRDSYIAVLGDRCPDRVLAFLQHHQAYGLDQEEQVDALCLLEMQRYSLLMYTSCGWFFEEISRPEGVQILCYAARALELAGELTGTQLEPEFLERLTLAPSNSPHFSDGADLYRQLVKTAQVSLEQIAAHHAMRSLCQTPRVPSQAGVHPLNAGNGYPLSPPGHYPAVGQVAQSPLHPAQGSQPHNPDFYGAGNSLQGHGLQGNSLQGNSLQGNSLQGNSLQGSSLQENSLQGNSLQGNRSKDRTSSDALATAVSENSQPGVGHPWAIAAPLPPPPHHPTLDASPSQSLAPQPPAYALVPPELQDPQQSLYCYLTHEEDYQLQRLGNLTLAVGQLRLVSAITWESAHVVFAVLHLGGWDFHCCVERFSGRLNYSKLKQELLQSLQAGSAAHSILAMNHLFDSSQTYNLQSLFAEERHRIMRYLTDETLDRLNQIYNQVYRSNYGILMAFHRDGLAAPRELQVAAEIALGYRIQKVLSRWEEALDPHLTHHPGTEWVQRHHHYLTELEELALEVMHFHCPLNLPEAQRILERLIWRSLWHLLQESDPQLLPKHFRLLNRLLAVGQQLHIDPSLAQAQELLYESRRHPWCQALLSYQRELGRLFRMVLT